MAIRVHVSQAVKSEIITWTRQANQGEIGGLLLGRVHKTEKGILVRVEAALLAQDAGSVGSSIRLTPEMVGSLSAEAKAAYPAFQVAGWFHTHAGLGAFLSSYDTAVHKENFPEPWQVALVFDSELGRESLYVWEGSDLVQVNSEEMTRVVRESAATLALGPARTQYRLVNPRRFYTVILLTLLLIAAGVGLIRWLRPAPPVEAPAVPPAPEAAVQPPAQEEDTPPAAAAPADADRTGQAKPPAVSGTVSGQKYIVRPGDTLWGISKHFYGQGELYPELSSINGLVNPRLLHPGEELVLPESLRTQGGSSPTEKELP